MPQRIQIRTQEWKRNGTLSEESNVSSRDNVEFRVAHFAAEIGPSHLTLDWNSNPNGNPEERPAVSATRISEEKPDGDDCAFSATANHPRAAMAAMDLSAHFKNQTLLKAKHSLFH